MTGDRALVNLHNPPAICAAGDRPVAPGEHHEWTAERRRRIAHRLGHLGLTLRAPGVEDLDAILGFLATRFESPALEMVNAYDLYRFVRFGHPLLLEDVTGRIAGSFLECAYGDRDRTSYCVSLAVAREHTGNRLGSELTSYSALAALDRGCRFQRAVVAPDNPASLAVFLNHCGHVAEEFHAELAGFGGPRLAVCCPLTESGLRDSRVDTRGVAHWMESARAGDDYMLVACDDTDRLRQMYRQTEFRIVAYLVAQEAGPPNHFLALRGHHLGLAAEAGDG